MFAVTKNSNRKENTMRDENIKLTIDPAAGLLKIKMPDGTVRRVEPEKNLPISADLAGFSINGEHYSLSLIHI